MLKSHCSSKRCDSCFFFSPKDFTTDEVENATLGTEFMDYNDRHQISYEDFLDKVMIYVIRFCWFKFASNWESYNSFHLHERKKNEINWLFSLEIPFKGLTVYIWCRWIHVSLRAIIRGYDRLINHRAYNYRQKNYSKSIYFLLQDKY